MARELYVRSAGGNLRRSSKPTKRQTERMRSAVYERDGFMCQECSYVPTDKEILDFYERGWNPGRLQLDHIKPYRDGGEFIPANLQTLCEPCNIRKSAT